MSDTQKNSVNQVETEPNLPKKGKFGRHCARFWWIYLIVFSIVVVVVVVPVIFVAVPKMIQDKLNESRLTIEGVIVSNPRSNALTMSINSTIYADDGVHATIGGFKGAMYLEDLPGQEPFAHFDFPATETASVITVNVTQDLTISNMDALITFNTWLLANETLRVTVEGRPTVRLRGLARNYEADFRKTVQVNGLNNFSGLEILNGSISVLPDENGDNFGGYVAIPNPSVFTLELGNITFSTRFEDEDVGVSRLDDLILYPGSNEVPMRANIDQVPILNAVDRRPYCEGADFVFLLSGLNVTSQGQNLTYFGIPLSRTEQEIEVPIFEYVRDDLNITPTCDP